MSDIKRTSEKISTKTTIFYSFAGIADTMSYQMFTFYIFNFYFAVKQLPLEWVTLGFIIWTIWNAINDPILGAWSDRTMSKWGRRKPWIIVGLIALTALVILVWTPPPGSITIEIVYFMIIINIFDFFYTMYSLNQTSLFPEMFVDLEQRAKANNYVQIFNIIGLLLAALIPSFFISEQVMPGREMEYVIASVVMAILAVSFGVIFITLGLKERKEYSKDPETAPSFFKSIKFSFKNKAFSTYVITNLAVWFVFGIFPIINPYFLRFILGIKEGFIQSLFLAIIFVSAIGFTFIWSKVFAKKGAKKAELIALFSLIITLLPFLIVWEIIGAIIAYVVLGFGFAGIMFGRDVMMSTIIDKDEIDTGIRREGAYYGVNALIIRLSTIAVYLSIFTVFNNIGWKIYDPAVVTDWTYLGLRFLLCLFPVIFLGLGAISLWKFPITKEKYEEIKDRLEELHGEKVGKVS